MSCYRHSWLTIAPPPSATRPRSAFAWRGRSMTSKRRRGCAPWRNAVKRRPGAWSSGIRWGPSNHGWASSSSRLPGSDSRQSRAATRRTRGIPSGWKTQSASRQARQAGDRLTHAPVNFGYCHRNPENLVHCHRNYTVILSL